jgi:hypothetical protein
VAPIDRPRDAVITAMHATINDIDAMMGQRERARRRK